MSCQVIRTDTPLRILYWFQFWFLLRKIHIQKFSYFYDHVIKLTELFLLCLKGIVFESLLISKMLRWETVTRINGNLSILKSNQKQFAQVCDKTAWHFWKSCLFNRYRTELAISDQSIFRATIFSRQKLTSACFKVSIDPNWYRQYIIGDNSNTK